MKHAFTAAIKQNLNFVLAVAASVAVTVGQFHNIHQIVTDSKGNVYTGEVDTGMRVQKFVPTMAPAK